MGQRCRARIGPVGTSGTQEVQIKSPKENTMSYWFAFMRRRNNSDYQAGHVVFTVQQHNAALPIKIAPQYLKFKVS